MLLEHTPFRHKSTTTVALLYMSTESEIGRCGFARPALTCLQFAPHDRKWLPNIVKLYGASSFAHRRKILLMQIILSSDYSGSVKEIGWLLQPVLRKVSLK